MFPDAICTRSSWRCSNEVKKFRFENDAPFNRTGSSTLFATPNLLGTADVAMDVISIGFKTDLSALSEQLR